MIVCIVYSIVCTCVISFMLSCNHETRPLEPLSFQLLQLATRMVVHGTLASFDPEVEDWTEYTDRLSYYFIANGISDNAKKCAILISCCGPAIFHLIKSLVFPDSLTDFSFAQLVEKVRVHREPKTSTILRRFQFNSRTRPPMSQWLITWRNYEGWLSVVPMVIC